MADCFQAIKELMGGSLDDKTIEQIVIDLEDIKKGIEERGESSELFVKAFQEKMTSMRTMSRFNARRALKSRAVIKAGTDFLMQDAWRGDIEEGVTSMLFGGAARLSKGGNLGIEQMYKRNLAKFYRNLSDLLDEDGLYEVFRSGSMDDDIAEALFQLGRGGDTSQISHFATKIAQVVKGIQDEMLNDLRLAGVPIGELEGYIIKQSHDARKMIGDLKDIDGGKKAWSEFVMERLDHERTFAVGMAESDKIKMLSEVFDEIVSGKNEHIDSGIGDEFVTIWDRKIIGAQIHKARKLHFKSGKDFMEYHRVYGYDGGLFESVHRSIDYNARVIALNDRLGYDSQANFMGIIKRLPKQLEKAGRKEEAEKVRLMLKPGKELQVSATFAARGGLQKMWDELTGVSSQGGRSLGAKMVRAARTIQNIRLLGSAGVRSVTDIATIMATLRASNGRTLFDQFAVTLKEFIAPLSAAEKKQFARKFQMVTEDELSFAAQRFNGDDQPGSGWLIKLERLFFRANGLHWWTTKGKISSSRLASVDLAERADMDFLKLKEHDARFAASLERYAITEAEWDLIRLAREKYADGNIGLTPEAIGNISSQEIRAIAKRHKVNAEKLKSSADIKLAAYIADHAEHGTPTPGGRQRSLLLGGEAADSISGMVRRLVAQFKSFSVTMHAMVGRSVLSNPSNTAKTLTEAINPFSGKTADVDNIIGLIVSGTALAYIADVALDIANNKTPKDVTPELIANMMVRSGVLGPYIDLVHSAPKHGIAEAIAGPVLTDAVKLTDTLLKGSKMSETDAKKLLTFPLPKNLPFVQAVIDYMIGYKTAHAIRIMNERGQKQLIE